MWQSTANNMYAWKLPTSIDVGGKKYKIRTDYRVILDILSALNDSEIYEGMSEDEKKTEQTMTMLQILYIDFKKIPTNYWSEAAEKACEFIDCGIKDTGKSKPRLMDWEKDAPVIIPAINKQTKSDIRSEKYMHWWTFFGLYMEIGESTFSTIVSIRDKKRKGEKLEKWEQEFYRNNRDLVYLNSHKMERSKEEKEALYKLFGKNTD